MLTDYLTPAEWHTAVVAGGYALARADVAADTDLLELDDILFAGLWLICRCGHTDFAGVRLESADDYETPPALTRVRQIDDAPLAAAFQFAAGKLDMTLSTLRAIEYLRPRVSRPGAEELLRDLSRCVNADTRISLCKDRLAAAAAKRTGCKPGEVVVAVGPEADADLIAAANNHPDKLTSDYVGAPCSHPTYRPTAGSTREPCAACRQDVWVSEAGRKLIAQLDRVRVICVPCAGAADLLSQH